MASKKDEVALLTPYEHARIRTEMYLSSRDAHTQVVLEYEGGRPKPVDTRWIPAQFVAFREILDNALDEVVTHGHGDTIKVTYDPKTNVVTIEDNGRGIPITKHSVTGQYQATLAVANTMAGRNFEDRGASRGLNGVGASIVNFCSEYFRMDIFRDGQHFRQLFEEGTKELKISEPLILPTKEKRTGTRIEFKLSPKVFKTFNLPESFIESRLYEIAICYPKLKVFYNGKQVTVAKTVEKSLFTGHKPIYIEMEDDGFHSRFWMVPRFFPEGQEFTHGLVNAIPVFNGGVHIETFRRVFFSGLIKALEKESKKRKLTPNRSDIADGMLLYNITQMNEPQFDSQSKTRMINENVGAIVSAKLNDPDFFKNVIKKNPEWIEQIYELCAARTMKKDASDASKLAKKNLRAKVEELEDACGLDRSKCILFLGEGRSAISGMVEARNPDLHGGLPLRGKVLNVFGKTPKDALQNQALSKIMTAVGLVPGQKAYRPQLRYGKVYITTDADEDGKNIAALLVNFFYTYWPELLEPSDKPFLYIFDTPLIIASKGKNKKYWYNEDYSDFVAEDYKGWEITRAKGLAALKRDDWRHVLENPKATPITDDGELKQALKLLFDDKLADDRKEWIGM